MKGSRDSKSRRCSLKSRGKTNSTERTGNRSKVTEVVEIVEVVKVTQASVGQKKTVPIAIVEKTKGQC